MIVIDKGESNEYLGNEKWEKMEKGIKEMEEEKKIRRRMMMEFEREEREKEMERRKEMMKLRIVGGGKKGVEMEGIIEEIERRKIWKEFRNIDKRKESVMIMEVGKRIM